MFFDFFKLFALLMHKKTNNYNKKNVWFFNILLVIGSWFIFLLFIFFFKSETCLQF